ncbi:MAG: hypothetical protein A2X13_11315 [Bacteroidetes bacterium GWC2_33_15]|nr:MAG: hypothetical protein A2X10_12710 [Bacteroidetes bacterium GWA2_33_15]OFX52376.1 MAG: hypothetical protein A2X13_11315 [Bacteroidetes bacterium GWC2_33_15]OFX64525.1 MAG: hypothetical protein A2X15_14170 [Bacteroidetes bacterium GWB2_32_14]OFX68939.1 MAG: hypothetical protein A2X14_08625 [Bacteroidetes bacterium GWD2_33_33]
MINCPICNKGKDIDYGKYICSECKSKFEYLPNGKIVLIKRNKFDYWIFVLSLIFPLIFIVLFMDNVARNNFYLFNGIFPGLMMIFYPLIITIRQVFVSGADSVTLINLYFIFFQKELHKEDIGRIIGFYLTFITNLIGLIFIIKYIIK